MRSQDDFRPGQVTVADLVYEGEGGIIILEMGGGKTASMMTGAADLIRDGLIDRVLIGAPPKVAATVWPNEPAKWAHLQHLVVLDGTATPAKRQALIRDWAAGKAQFLTFSLANAKRVFAELGGMDLSRTLFLIDEISALKSPTGALAKEVEKIAPRFFSVWGATGTPRPNGWEDLFRPIRIVTKGTVWGGKSWTDWRRDHFRPMDMNGYDWRIHTFAEKQFEQDVQGIAHYIPTEHVEGLPELRIGPEFDRVVELPDKARSLYDKMEKDLLIRVLGDLKGEPDEETVIVALFKAAASAKLEQLAQGYVYDEGEAFASVHTEKRDALEEMLLEAGAEPVVICYRFREDIALAEQIAGRLPVLGGGTTPAQARRHIEQFSQGKIARLLLHPASAGHGVDGLQNAGRRMIWLGPTWSNEQYDQTVKRLYRPGQTKTTYSHRIIAKDTVDELKVARVKGKSEAQDAFKQMLKRAGM